ncbi:MAG: Stp1/IreP family PP2C-type Ser/Thr phosphatase [Lachnospiraceae bacterium]|nr:Stp1/IreP family PP2C-type Ser/Thr phosphatase [Lachnospiraceae bacterium]
MRYSALTDLGLVRSNNEDSLYAGDSAVGRLKNLFIVADGMGGHVGGEYASAFVVSKIPDLLEKRQQQEESIEDTLRIVTDRTNKALYQLSRNDKRLQGMGSTLVMASIEEGEAHVINVGDSRLYHFDGTLTQITHDHALVDEMVAKGKLTKDDPFYAANKNVITRAMGVSAYVEPDYFCVPLKEGDRLLLCSDGLSGMIDDETIAGVLADEADTAAAAEKLMELAKESGGRDNISVILIDPDAENS